MITRAGAPTLRRTIVIAAVVAGIVWVLATTIGVVHTHTTHYTKSSATVLSSSYHGCFTTGGKGKNCDPYTTRVRAGSRTVRFTEHSRRLPGSHVTVWTSGNEVFTTDPRGALVLFFVILIGLAIGFGVGALTGAALFLYGRRGKRRAPLSGALGASAPITAE